MYILSQFCSLCLNPNKDLSRIHNENFQLIYKLNYCVPEIQCTNEEFVLYICSDCQNKLNEAHSFIEMCIENYAAIVGYVFKLKNKDAAENQQSLPLVHNTDLKEHPVKFIQNLSNKCDEKLKIISVEKKQSGRKLRERETQGETQNYAPQNSRSQNSRPQNGGLQNGSQDSGPQNGSQDGGLQNGSQDGGLQNGSQDGGPQNESQDGGPQNESQDGGLQNGSQDGGPQNGSQDGGLVREGVLKTCFSNKSTNKEFVIEEKELPTKKMKFAPVKRKKKPAFNYKRRTFRCKVCNKTFGLRSSLTKHVTEHQKNSIQMVKTNTEEEVKQHSALSDVIMCDKEIKFVPMDKEVLRFDEEIRFENENNKRIREAYKEQRNMNEETIYQQIDEEVSRFDDEIKFELMDEEVLKFDKEIIFEKENDTDFYEEQRNKDEEIKLEPIDEETFRFDMKIRQENNESESSEEQKNNNNSSTNDEHNYFLRSNTNNNNSSNIEHNYFLDLNTNISGTNEPIKNLLDDNNIIFESINETPFLLPKYTPTEVNDNNNKTDVNNGNEFVASKFINVLNNNTSLPVINDNTSLYATASEIMTSLLSANDNSFEFGNNASTSIISDNTASDSNSKLNDNNNKTDVNNGDEFVASKFINVLNNNTSLPVINDNTSLNSTASEIITSLLSANNNSFEFGNNASTSIISDNTATDSNSKLSKLDENLNIAINDNFIKMKYRFLCLLCKKIDSTQFFNKHMDKHKSEQLISCTKNTDILNTKRKILLEPRELDFSNKYINYDKSIKMHKNENIPSKSDNKTVFPYPQQPHNDENAFSPNSAQEKSEKVEKKLQKRYIFNKSPIPDIQHSYVKNVLDDQNGGNKMADGASLPKRRKIDGSIVDLIPMNTIECLLENNELWKHLNSPSISSNRTKNSSELAKTRTQPQDTSQMIDGLNVITSDFFKCFNKNTKLPSESVNSVNAYNFGNNSGVQLSTSDKTDKTVQDSELARNNLQNKVSEVFLIRKKMGKVDGIQSSTSDNKTKTNVSKKVPIVIKINVQDSVLPQNNHQNIVPKFNPIQKQNSGNSLSENNYDPVEEATNRFLAQNNFLMQDSDPLLVPNNFKTLQLPKDVGNILTQNNSENNEIQEQNGGQKLLVQNDEKDEHGLLMPNDYKNCGNSLPMSNIFEMFMGSLTLKQDKLVPIQEHDYGKRAQNVKQDSNKRLLMSVSIQKQNGGNKVANSTDTAIQDSDIVSNHTNVENKFQNLVSIQEQDGGNTTVSPVQYNVSESENTFNLEIDDTSSDVDNLSSKVSLNQLTSENIFGNKNQSNKHDLNVPFSGSQFKNFGRKKLKKTFKCYVCHRKFCTKRNLEKHLKYYKHYDESSEENSFI